MAKQTVVIKIGSSTLVDSEGKLNRAYIEKLCAVLSRLVNQGYFPIVVSSGAAAAGISRLGLESRPKDIPTLQACCAAGQADLTECYAKALASHGIACGQVLLTRSDIMDRSRYILARTTFKRLLELGAIPVVNENDTLSTAELSFGDNDMLGAIVSALTEASSYVIFSDVDGLYTANPSSDPEAKRIDLVQELSPEILSMATGSSSPYGTGGMASKLRAARCMLAAGIPMYICHGKDPEVLLDLVSGKVVGTRFIAASGANFEPARKLWIGMASAPVGSIVVDDGALEALQNSGASLLSVGISRVEGSFHEGDIVNIKSSTDELVGRGISRHESSDICKNISRGDVCIHRDDLLIF